MYVAKGCVHVCRKGVYMYVGKGFHNRGVHAYVYNVQCVCRKGVPHIQLYKGYIIHRTIHPTNSNHKGGVQTPIATFNAKRNA